MRRLFLVLFVFGFTALAHGQVVINEVQSSNGFTLEDEDGDNEDWIELYNAGAEPVNLEGYWLSDNYDNPFRWAFPEVSIGPGQTLLVWASGKDRAQPGSPLHTNFSLSAGGEELLLSASSGVLLDEVPPVAIPTDISWGRAPSGSDNWVFFDSPTPAQYNSPEGLREILAVPSFSSPGGFYANTLDLIINHPDPEATIIYTTDGSIPSLESLDGVTYSYKNQYRNGGFGGGGADGELLTNEFQSHIYQGALLIADRSPEPNKLANIATSFHQNPGYFPDEPLIKGTVVRARAVKDGAIASSVVTHTYFITQGGENPYQMPVISLGVQEDGLFDYYEGIHVAGAIYDEWRDNNTFFPADGSSPANWQMRGLDWERPSHLELFEPGANQADLVQDIGVRIHGGWSRVAELKSLRLYARNAYGDSRFNYRVFPDMDDEQYNRLILRNSGNDRPYTMFRDALIQSLGKDMRMDTQAYRPSVVFVNGEYWGILNIRERYDRHYLARTHGVDPDRLDFLSNNNQVGEGDALHYEATIQFIENNSLVADANFAEVQTRVDTDNFMDYTIANIFANNTDWPANNIDYWRLRTDEYQPDAPEGHDGRWRWLWFDTDFGFGLYDGEDGAQNNTLAYATQPNSSGWSNAPWSTFLLRSLLENSGFRDDFINRFADLLNTSFSAEQVVPLIRSKSEVVETEIANHIQRWGSPRDIEDWHENVDIMVAFAQARPQYQREHLRDYFGLGGDYTLTVNSEQPQQGTVRVNSLALNDSLPGSSGSSWSGIYFGGLPVELEALPAPGYTFSHWSGLPDGAPALTTLNASEDTVVTAYFVAGQAPFVHAWLFDNELANNTPLETVDSFISYGDPARIIFQSALLGYPFDEQHELWRRASMERRNAPTPVNYLLDTPYEDVTMRGLQVRQPFVGDGGENALIFELPTTGRHNALFQFAAMDEGAADSLIIDYSVSAEAPVWITAGLSQVQWPLAEEFQLFSLDFSSIAEVNDNPHFRVRIRFSGADMSADNGDRVTFNNFTLEADEGPGEPDPTDPTDPTQPPVLANNHFEQSQAVTGLSGTTMADSSSASLEPGEPDHGQMTGMPADHSLWWTWEAPETERMVFSVDNSNTLAIYTGSALSELEPVAADYLGTGDMWFVAQAGQSYRIAVLGSDGSRGEARLAWEPMAPAATPQITESELGEAVISCEVASCEVDALGNLFVSATENALWVTLPSQGVDAEFQHQMQGLDDQGQPLWATEFNTVLPGVSARIIADTQGSPIVISRLTRADGLEYQVEAYPDGIARHRMVAEGGTLAQLHLTIPGSHTVVQEDGRLSVVVPLSGQRRILLELSSSARLTARYQHLNGELWESTGDLLIDTEFSAGSHVVVARDSSGPRIEIETLVDDHLTF